MPEENIYQNNFIKGVKMLMATESIESIKEAADFLGLSYMGLYKVMDKTNKPTVEHGSILCAKAGYSANWLFLGKGSIYYQEEITLQDTLKAIIELKKAINNLD